MQRGCDVKWASSRARQASMACTPSGWGRGWHRNGAAGTGITNERPVSGSSAPRVYPTLDALRAVDVIGIHDLVLKAKERTIEKNGSPSFPLGGQKTGLAGANPSPSPASPAPCARLRSVFRSLDVIFVTPATMRT